MKLLLVFILFVVFLVMGMPIAFAIGISGAAFFLQYTDSLPFTMTVQLAISQTQNFPLLAIPLFIFSANLMNETGLTQRLINLASVLTGHMRGGLAQVSVVLSALMGGVSGSAIADAAMEARILGPDMINDGYSKGYASSILTVPSNITAIIPPSIALILYGTIGEVSIGRLFAAGLPVGLLMDFLSAETDADVMLLAVQPHHVQFGAGVSREVAASVAVLATLLTEALAGPERSQPKPCSEPAKEPA